MHGQQNIKKKLRSSFGQCKLQDTLDHTLRPLLPILAPACVLRSRSDSTYAMGWTFVVCTMYEGADRGGRAI